MSTTQKIKGEEIFETTVEGDDDNAEPQVLKSYQDSVMERQVLSGEDQIVDAKLNPEDAFQVFNGRVFNQPKAEYFSLADTIERRAEAPLQRLARLRSEIDELKFDLDAMVDTDKEAKSGSIWSVLQSQTAHLKQSAETLQKHRAFDLAHDQLAESEKSLSELIEGFRKLGTDKLAGSGSKSGTGGKSEGPSTGAEHGSGTGMKGLAGRELAALENRVHKLETMLGSVGNRSDTDTLSQLYQGGGSLSQVPFPLVDAIAKLESRVQMLNPAEIEVLRGKCNGLKLDLDAAVKSKATSHTEVRAIEAVQTLHDFVGKVDKVEAVAGDLPTLVVRLKTLEHVHLSASTFQTRLQQMESDVKNLTGELASNREVLDAMRVSMADNLQIVEQNVASVNWELKKR